MAPATRVRQLTTEAIRVHLSSTLIGVDEEYLELVGLLGVVDPYNQGFLRLR